MQVDTTAAILKKYFKRPIESKHGTKYLSESFWHLLF